MNETSETKVSSVVVVLHVNTDDLLLAELPDQKERLTSLTPAEIFIREEREREIDD